MKMAKQKSGATRRAAKKKAKREKKPDLPECYNLEVRLVGGMVTEGFVEKSPVISRTIEILGDQTLESLGLRVRKQIDYRFDYGDEWWHKITVGKIGEASGRCKYPRVTERVGRSPPQYPNSY